MVREGGGLGTRVTALTHQTDLSSALHTLETLQDHRHITKPNYHSNSNHSNRPALKLFFRAYRYST